jgi:hypothetical protein
LEKKGDGQSWNGGFFKERPASDYSTYQRSGHLGLGKVLRSPHVDFLVSPYSYGFRGIARFAGVHIYSEAGDVLYASRLNLVFFTGEAEIIACLEKM